MGIRGLYTNLLPHARPETFSGDSRTLEPLYIDGPGLCYHIYHLLFCALNTSLTNAFDTAVPYEALASAMISYLDRLSASGFTMKIYFDGALPAFKAATRRARLDESLKKLHVYRSTATALPSPPASQRSRHVDSASFFAADFTPEFTPASQPLSAPPFIILAALSALAKHPYYAPLTHTVPGEADPFLARDATMTGGLVLTGDSDLLLFVPAVPPPRQWGVVMFRDLDFIFATSSTARVFRPAAMATSLRFPLLEIAYEISRDSTATLAVILARLVRVKERSKAGVGGDEVPASFREEYTFPLPAAVPPAAPRLVEPRISELLHLRGASGQKQMYLPFLWEDAQRASAWDVAQSIRAHAYALLFGEGTTVEEVYRRGVRIVETPVVAVDNPTLITTSPIVLVLDEILAACRSPPSVQVLACVVSCILGTKGSGKRGTWNWEKAHLFAQLHAGWYSLLLLSEAQRTVNPETAPIVVPELASVANADRFLTEPGEEALAAAGDALGRYWATQGDDGGEGVGAEDESSSNGNGKRSRDAAMGGGGGKKRRKRGSSSNVEASGDGGGENGGEVEGSRFGVLDVE